MVAAVDGLMGQSGKRHAKTIIWGNCNENRASAKFDFNFIAALWSYRRGGERLAEHWNRRKAEREPPPSDNKRRRRRVRRRTWRKKATMRFGNKPGAVMEKEMPHEVGHLFNLDDEYMESKDPVTGKRITPSKPGKENSLMATTKASATISEDHIEAVIKSYNKGGLNKGIELSR